MRWRSSRDAREPSIVAFGSPDGFIGVGLFNGGARILTCAHVVADALGVPRSTDLTGMSVSVHFPFLKTEPETVATVRTWRSLEHGDFAGLTLERVPRHARPGRLLTQAKSLEGQKASTFGFPADFTRDGIWASVVVKRNQANGLTQVEGVHGEFEIDPGFSGSPVWLTDHDVVIGLVRRDDARGPAAFVTPAQTISKWWPGGKIVWFPIFSPGRWFTYFMRAMVGIAALIGGLLVLRAYAMYSRNSQRDTIDKYITEIDAQGSARPKSVHDLSQLNPEFGLESHAISEIARIVRQQHQRGPTCARRDSTDASVQALDSLFDVVRQLERTAAADRRIVPRVLERLLAWSSPDGFAPTADRSFARTDLSGARLDSIHLTGASFEGACLAGSHFDSAIVDSAIFAGDTLDNATFIGAWARGSHFRDAALRGADLSGAHLERAYFVGANLSCAQFGNGYLNAAEFEYATAAWAYFGHTTLTGASNWSAIRSLRNANFEWPVDSAAIEIQIARDKGGVFATPLDEWTTGKNLQFRPGGACAQ